MKNYIITDDKKIKFEDVILDIADIDDNGVIKDSGIKNNEILVPVILTRMAYFLPKGLEFICASGHNNWDYKHRCCSVCSSTDFVIHIEDFEDLKNTLDKLKNSSNTSTNIESPIDLLKNSYENISGCSDKHTELIVNKSENNVNEITKSVSCNDSVNNTNFIILDNETFKIEDIVLKLSDVAGKGVISSTGILNNPKLRSAQKECSGENLPNGFKLVCSRCRKDWHNGDTHCGACGWSDFFCVVENFDHIEKAFKEFKQSNSCNNDNSSVIEDTDNFNKAKRIVNNMLDDVESNKNTLMNLLSSIFIVGDNKSILISFVVLQLLVEDKLDQKDIDLFINKINRLLCIDNNISNNNVLDIVNKIYSIVINS